MRIFKLEPKLLGDGAAATVAASKAAVTTRKLIMWFFS